MDKWIAEYLEEWQTDFGAEPDAESSFKFVKDALMAFKNLLPSGSSPITSLEAVASLIATRVNKQDDPRDFLQYLQGVIFAAAAISPLDPSDLAEVIRIFLQKLSSPDAEWFRYDFAKNTRERWNGPDTPGAEKSKEQCIREWVSLNMLIAHLTRLHTISLETYALRTFYRTFDSEANENQLDYNVPASGAWIDILGKEIYQWCMMPREAGCVVSEVFNQGKWEVWKQGFQKYSKVESHLSPRTKVAADVAWLKMDSLQAGHGQ